MQSSDTPQVDALITVRGAVLGFGADDAVRGPSSSVAGLLPETALTQVLGYYDLEDEQEGDPGPGLGRRRHVPRRIPLEEGR